MTINFVAVLLASLAGFAFGAVYYPLLSKPWLAALETTGDSLRIRHNPAWLPFAVTFVSQLVMAFVLAGLIGHMAPVSARSGLISGVFCFVGFVLPTMVANYAFQGRRLALSLIDGGHWLGVLAIQGAVIGLLSGP